MSNLRIFTDSGESNFAIDSRNSMTLQFETSRGRFNLMARTDYAGSHYLEMDQTPWNGYGIYDPIGRLVLGTPFKAQANDHIKRTAQVLHGAMTRWNDPAVRDSLQKQYELLRRFLREES